MTANACTQTNCAGLVLPDGYCDTCGVKGLARAAAAPVLAHPAPEATGLACTVAECRGLIAPDGYCDTCGTKATTGSNDSSPPVAVSSARADAPPATAPSVGESCNRTDCGGTIATDGYCDTCGIKAAASSGPSSAPGAASTPSQPQPSIAAPVAPTTSTRVGASERTGASRRTASSRRSAAARDRLGAGLVDIVPTQVGDPAGAVMSAEKIQASLGEVAEEDRNCSNCGTAVGRSTADRPGRVTGFCGTCRTPYDFQTNAPQLRAGDLVAGQYEIAGPLAHGGMGWIYLGRDQAVSGRWVVLKGLLNEDDPDAVASAVAERQFLAQIEHPNIVNIYNFVTWAGAGYIVMEFVGGESLNDKLKDRRRANGGRPAPLPIAEAIAYLLGILPVFGYLHDQNLVYNDLKPANVMAVGEDVKLIDVGAVMRADDLDAAIFGTAGFQAPEVASVGPSPASDLYTVGRTLAVLILNFVFHTGRYEHSIPSPADEPVMREWESLYRFLLKATAEHPDDRFQTADGMAEQLLGVLREIVARSTGQTQIASSSLFGGDRLTGLLLDADADLSVSNADWRVLPMPRRDPEDPATSFLSGLTNVEPGRAMELIQRATDDGTIPVSREAQLAFARLLIESGEDGEAVLTPLAQEDPWEWRVGWYRSLAHMIHGRHVEAAEGFSTVWTEVPGELAPKLAVGLAAELAGELGRASEIYGQVIAVDSSHVSAAFGLARCRTAEGDRDGAVEAYGRVPSSSAGYYDAQIASTRTRIGEIGSSAPTADELAEAAATIDRMQLDATDRANLATEILERALESTASGSRATTHATIFGHAMNEKGIRKGLESAYRELARLAPTPAERIALIDRANEVRPRSLV